MANRYPSDDYYSRSSQGSRSAGGYNARPAGSARPASSGARTSSGSYGARPAGSSRPASGARTSSGSYNARPTGNRPSGVRPPQNGNRRPPRRRKKKAQGRFYLFLAIALILIIALVLIIVKPFGGKDKPVPKTSDPVSINMATPVPDLPANVAVEEPQETHYSNLNEMLADGDNPVGSLSEDEMAKVDNLSINTDLPDTWMNILLLGTDERVLNTSARTDTMIICSINKTTGEVKLSSIMRDTNVRLDNIGEYSGDYRINAANYFGGPNLAMKTVNELFNMNVENYVMVNFFGFQKIAQKLGGITIDITEAEMNEINKLIYQQAKVAYQAGIDESDLENNWLTTYGNDTHLDGRQTLAYARVRKIDNDYERAKRQRLVLNELLGKLKNLSAMEIAQLAVSMSDQVKTNMKIEDIINIAMVVIGNGMSEIESLRLPVTGSYSEERRNNDARLWDTDTKTNFTALYNFIYE